MRKKQRKNLLQKTHSKAVLKKNKKDEESSFEDFVTHAPVGMIRVSPEGQILLANNALLKMLGYESVEQLASINLEEFYHPETPRSLVIEEAKKSGTLTGFIARWKRKDGSFIYVRLSSRAVRDQKGKLLYFEGTVEDITRQHLIEETLSYTRKLERLISEVSLEVVGLALDDIDRGINRALEKLGKFFDIDRCYICRFSKDKNASKILYEWYADEISQLISPTKEFSLKKIPHFSEITAKGGVVNFSRISEIPDEWTNEREWLQSRKIKSIALVSLIWSGNVIGWLGLEALRKEVLFSNDILAFMRILTEVFAEVMARRSATSALVHERILISALMDNMPDHIYFKDMQSRFIRINKAHAISLGLKEPSEVIGKTDYDFFSEEHARKAFEDEQRIIKTGEPLVAIEEKIIRKDGSTGWVSTTKLPLRDGTGKIVGTFGISRDITEIKKVEEEKRKLEARIQQTQKLESLGLLSSEIAHDFNNFLAGIMGNTGLALAQLSPSSKAWGYIKQIEAITARSAELTNQMLAYAGKSKFIKESLVLSSLIREMSELLTLSVPHRIKMCYELTDNIPAFDADITQIRQVVMNLVTNAADAIGECDGTITIRTGVTQCDRTYLSQCYVDDNLPVGTYVFIEVVDTGCGMDASTQARIFDPFFTTKAKGRGLGLASVLGIVRAHRGTLKVYSERGHGTRFRILFPASSSAPPKQKQEIEDIQGWCGSGGVLIVDDEEMVRIVTGGLVASYGFTPYTAGDGKTAEHLLTEKSSEIVLALIDVSMPEMANSKLLADLRKIKPDMKIILVSGYGKDAATEGISEPFDGFLQKPFSSVQIAIAMKNVLCKPDKSG